MADHTSPAYSCCIHCRVISSGTVTDRSVPVCARNSVFDIQLSYAAALILVRKCCLIRSQQFITASRVTAAFAHIFHSLWKIDVNGSVLVGPARRQWINHCLVSLQIRQSSTDCQACKPL